MIAFPAAAQEGTAWSRRGPEIDGILAGSVRVMTAEDVELAGVASISGDLQIPGTPGWRVLGRAVLGSVADGGGLAVPNGHEVKLSGSASVGRLLRRVAPATWQPVPALPGVTGTRSVVLREPGPAPVDFRTVRDLTIESKAGTVVLPAGNYGSFEVNAGASLVLGDAGAAAAVQYSFRKLSLKGPASLQVRGPVEVVLGEELKFTGEVGNPLRPEWLRLRFVKGGVELEAGARLNAHVEALAGTVVVGGKSRLNGGAVADRLQVRSGGELRLLLPPNVPPQVRWLAPGPDTVWVAPAAVSVVAEASDADGRIVKVEFWEGMVKVGEASAPPYRMTVNGVLAGTHTYVARAFDDRGASTDSPSLTVLVKPANVLPQVTLVAPPAGSVVTAPGAFTLVATASDPDGGISAVEFFDGVALLGRKATPPYELAISGLAAGAHRLQATATDLMGLKASSLPVEVIVNSPPSIVLEGSAAGLIFTAPAAVVLTARASDVDGTIARVEFYRGSERVGSVVTPPYTVTVAEAAEGSFAFTARAWDNRGAVGQSAPVNVLVRPANQAPVVSLVRPVGGAVYLAPANVLLEANASDPDGRVARVEFYQGDTRLAESLVPPFQFAWQRVPPGSHVLTAKAFDEAGASAMSPAVQIRVDIGVPYFTGFELEDGYAVGALAGQLGWTSSGVAAVAAKEGQGTSSALLVGGVGAGMASRSFPVSSSGGVMFGDVFVRPSADTDPSRGVFMDADGVVVALVGGMNGAEFQVRRESAGGTASWQGTGVPVPLSADGRARAWVRLTWRVDPLTRRFDLWIDGRLAVVDVPLASGASGLIGAMTWFGRMGGPLAIDDLYVGFENPLFADADRDGMDDAWEASMGGDPKVNDRTLDRDGDGLSTVEEYRLGTHPGRADTDGDGVDDGIELGLGLNPKVADADLLPGRLGGLRLHLKADAGLVLDAGGRVQVWEDQGGGSRHATQASEASRPVRLAPGPNGQPAVWFDGYDDFLRLGSPLTGASEGEILIVLRTEATAAVGSKTLWNFGTSPAFYPHGDGSIFEAFGSTVGRLSPVPEADLGQWRLYGVAASSGRWRSRLDGQTLAISEGNAFVAGADVVLGYAGSPNFGRSFHGAVAELLVFDRVLSWREREEVHRYLARRHGLVSAVPGLAVVAARAVSSSQVSLTWTGGEGFGNMVSVVERRAAGGEWETRAVLENGWSHLDELPAGMTTAAYRVRLVALGATSGFGPVTEVSVAGLDPVGVPWSRVKLWLKADHAIGSTRVSLWPDVSGGGHHAVPVAGLLPDRQPSRVAAGWQGRPVVRFDGYDDALALPEFMRGAIGAEVHAVLRATGAVGGGRRTLWTMGGGETFFPGDDGGIHEGWAARSPWSGPVPARDLSAWMTYDVTADGSRWVSRIDGHLYRESRSNVPTFNSSPMLGFGGSLRFGRAFEGEIAEILVFDGALSEAERAAVVRYLNLRFPRVDAPPATPAGLVVKAVSSTQASLSWSWAPEAIAATHEIERQDSGGPFRRVGTVVDAASFLDDAIRTSASIGYRVRSRNPAGVSPWSPVVAVTLPSDGVAVPLSALRLWISADHGVLPGRLPTWPDRSGLAQHAWQPLAGSQPSLAVLPGGMPVVRLDAAGQSLLLPDVLAGAVEGEILAVLRAAEAQPAALRTLWSWGSTPTYYPTQAGRIREGFGGADYNEGPIPAVALDQFHLYDVTAERTGTWISRINAGVYHARRGNTVAFRSDPSLGYVGSTSFGSAFRGDLLEIMVFGRTLTYGERRSVSGYLVGKYPLPGMGRPAAPAGLKAAVVSGTQLNLTWSVPASAVGLTYVVERRSGSGGFVVAGSVAERLAFLDGGRIPGEALAYRVKAVGLGGESDYSESIALTMPAGALGVELPGSGPRLWLRADLEPLGPVSIWSDQSGWSNHALPLASANQPTRVVDAEGRAGVRFDGQDDYLTLSNFLGMTGEAEAFVVVRAAEDRPALARGLWRFSSSPGSAFPDTSGALVEDFGSTWSRSLGEVASPLSSYGVYSLSAGAGLWSARMNGQELRSSRVNTVSFRSDPWLGSSSGAAFAGDIAEILIFDRTLSDSEREAVGSNLAQRHRLAAIPVPEAPRSLQAEIVFPSQVRLVWSATSLDAGVVISVERQVNGQAFNVVGEVGEAGRFIDAKPPTGVPLAYRVRARSYGGFSGYSNVAAIVLPVDRDGDGLPDEWESRFGTKPDVADAAADPDGDGLINADEFRRGGNPQAGVQADSSPVRLRVHAPRTFSQP